MTDTYSWSTAYARAILEDDEGQRNRIHEAELAIVRRSLEPGVSMREFRAMQTALDILKGIHKNEGKPLYEVRY